MQNQCGDDGDNSYCYHRDGYDTKLWFHNATVFYKALLFVVTNIDTIIMPFQTFFTTKRRLSTFFTQKCQKILHSRNKIPHCRQVVGPRLGVAACRQVNEGFILALLDN